MKFLLSLIFVQLVIVSARDELRPPIDFCGQICPRPLVMNPLTCACECGINQDSCVNLQNFNADTCRCECKIQETIRCPNFDPIACICPDQPHCEFLCLDVYQDPITCECGCRNTCDKPFVIDPKTCECGCEKNQSSCVNLQTFNDDRCECQCRQEESLGCRKFDFDLCICRDCNNTCPKGVYQDPETCECKCENTCVDPWVIDPKTCECECEKNQSSCVNLQTFNDDKCGCECRPEAVGDCKNFDYDACRCLDSGCPRPCPLNFYQDPKTCDCYCRETCEHPRTLDPKTCKCECGTGPDCCGNMQNFNEDTCLCECQAMTWVRCENFDPITCRCP